MENVVVQGLFSVLVALISTSAMIWIARHKNAAPHSSGVSGEAPQTMSSEALPASRHTPHDNHNARPRRFGVALLLVLWGQANIVVSSFLPSAGVLSPQIVSFVAQGAVFMLIGLWLMLRD